MKVVTQNVLDLFEPERKVEFKGGLSERILLERDGMGFSLHRTTIPKGGPYRWHYKNHLEACYCVSGLAQVIKTETKQMWIIEPGDTYVLDDHDEHTFEALEDTVLISVFNPPVKGQEIHKEDGSYEI